MGKYKMDETLAHLFNQTALRVGSKEAILFCPRGRLESRMTYSRLRHIPIGLPED